TSFRAVRSPVAPRMTIVSDGGMRPNYPAALKQQGCRTTQQTRSKALYNDGYRLATERTTPMNWLFRPSILAIVSAGLALSAMALVLWPRTSDNRALPLPLAEGDQEIVWLYAATNAAPWERFVTAVDKAVQRLHAEHGELALEMDARNAFPRQTTGISELALSVKGKKGRLWFRW